MYFQQKSYDIVKEKIYVYSSLTDTLSFLKNGDKTYCQTYGPGKDFSCKNFFIFTAQMKTSNIYNNRAVKLHIRKIFSPGTQNNRY